MTPAGLIEHAAHAFWDTVPMVPVLMVLYTALEFLSHYEGSRLLTRARLPRAFGPVAGALLGVIPQCGMSVFLTSLFLAGRVTTGTLVATYVATSDEAIPVLLAHGSQLRTVGLILGIKLVAGVVSGWLIDAVVPGLPTPAAAVALAPAAAPKIQAHVETEMHRAPWTMAVTHGVRRTLEIFGWVYAITLAFGLVVDATDLDALTGAARNHPWLELLGVTFFGLIPNCSASIAIAEGYLRGVLTFGAAVGGLCAGAGYGPILLFRRGVLGTAIRLLLLCLVFSLLTGAIAGAV